MPMHSIDTQDFDNSAEILLGISNIHCITHQEPFEPSSWLSEDAGIIIGQNVAC